MGGPVGGLHHLELWVEDLAAARPRWEWLLGRLGHVVDREWPGGVALRRGDAYVVLEQSPALVPGRHDRLRAGLNHVALWAGTADDLDALVAEAPAHGWSLMFVDRHPWAGGPDHRAAFLEDDGGFEVELVCS